MLKKRTFHLIAEIRNESSSSGPLILIWLKFLTASARGIQQIHSQSIVEQESCTSQRTCTTQNTTTSSSYTNWKDSHDRNAKIEWMHERENERRRWPTSLLPTRTTVHQERRMFCGFHGTGENLDKAATVYGKIFNRNDHKKIIRYGR